VGGITNKIRKFFGSLFKRQKKAEKETLPGEPIKLSRPFTLAGDCDAGDPYFRELMEVDLQGKDTPLQLMKYYADILDKSASHGDIDKKLDRLFQCGKTPDSMDGYYHGITISLKTGTDRSKLIDEICKKLNIREQTDPLQVFYGKLLSQTSPWAGKNFKMLGKEKLGQLTDGFDNGEETAYLGINSFRKDNKGYLNNIAGYVLSGIMDMEGVPEPERKRRSWIFSRGGLFIAKRQKSVDKDNPHKEVVALNYRWKELGNRFPNSLLVDELVQIAEGLYLGKLFYATELSRITRDYDPNVSNKDYKYRSFGYFLLMDDSWLHEKNMLFPAMTYEMADDLPEKFSTFRLADANLSELLRNRLQEGHTVLHYLQDLSRGVDEGSESEEEYFQQMHRLFAAGERPDGISGFFHGGVVAFRSAGLLKKLDKNVLNDLWPSVRPFSPWTGKTFNRSSLEGIRKYIGPDAEYYRDFDPVILGTNTYRRDLDLSLAATAFIEHLNKIGMPVEYRTEDEKSEDIFVKSFFFVATNKESINPRCEGKKVLQFNYRWPEFHTMPPDCLCIDELVRIADGLYLGQLLYSTEPGLKYDPDADPARYKYENFGYFMLMDDDWHAIKEFIDFDTESLRA